MAAPSVINDGDNDNNRPLRKLAEAFKSLSNSIISANDDNNNDFQNQENSLHELALACSLVYPLFRALGSIFRFAEIEYRSKVDDLVEASKSISTLQAMIDGEIESKRVRKGGSHTRNLLLVKRGLDMIRVLCEQIIATDGDSIVGPVSVAYAQVFGKHHCCWRNFVTTRNRKFAEIVERIECLCGCFRGFRGLGFMKKEGAGLGRCLDLSRVSDSISYQDACVPICLYRIKPHAVL